LTVWVRSSPIGVGIYFTYGAMANTTDTAGLKLLGTATRGWTKLSTTFTTAAVADSFEATSLMAADASSSKALGATHAEAGSGKPAPTASVQLMFAPAAGKLEHCGGTHAAKPPDFSCLPVPVLSTS